MSTTATGTMSAHWASPTPERFRTQRRQISSAADVEALLFALACEPLAEAAFIVHQQRPLVPDPITEDGTLVHDHELIVAARDGWGYMHMWTIDDPNTWILRGDPTSPRYVQGESEFPAGTAVPVAQLAQALHEFLTTAQRPQCVEWVPSSGP
jgi:hypothetical protein